MTRTSLDIVQPTRDLGFALVTHAPHDARARALPVRQALAFFDAWCSEARASAAVWTTLVTLGVALGGRLSDELASLRSRVRSALADGRLLALRETPIGSAGVVPLTPEAEEPEEPTARREVKTWVTIRLLDDRDPPRPVANARYRIKLPDGSVHTGALDASGVAHFEGIDPGQCEVSFPELDRDAWERA